MRQRKDFHPVTDHHPSQVFHPQQGILPGSRKSKCLATQHRSASYHTVISNLYMIVYNDIVFYDNPVAYFNIISRDTRPFTDHTVRTDPVAGCRQTVLRISAQPVMNDLKALPGRLRYKYTRDPLRQPVHKFPAAQDTACIRTHTVQKSGIAHKRQKRHFQPARTVLQRLKFSVPDQPAVHPLRHFG